MKISGTYLNSTPIFTIPAMESSKSHYLRAWGGVEVGSTLRFPAYYPFGNRVIADLRVIDPKLEWDGSAKDMAQRLAVEERNWRKVQAAYDQKTPVPLIGMSPDEESSFFPENFRPYEHQRYGINRIQLWPRTFFLWEMGSGKTRTAIDGFRFLRRKEPAVKMLVLAPTVVLPTWVREVSRCSKNTLNAVIWDGTDSARRAAATADVVVLTYTRAFMEWTLKSEEGVSELYQWPFSVITADESHSIGNWTSGQTKAVLELSQKAPRRYALSGTAADHPGKVYPQLRYLAPALAPVSWERFQKTHFVFAADNKHLIRAYCNLDDLNARIEMVATRVKKKDCLDLPPVTFVDVPFDLAPEQKAEYDACIARLKSFHEYEALEELKGRGVPVVHGASLVNKLLQALSGFLIEGADLLICNGCPQLIRCVDNKIKPYTEKCQVVNVKPPSTVRKFQSNKRAAFEQLLENILTSDPTNKVICWANYAEELNDMEEIVKRLKYGFVRVDGKTSKFMGEMQDKFQDDPECRVYLGQVSSGVGVTLTAANYMIYYALTWNLTSYKQSLERNNRPGQTRNMTVYRLLSADPNALDRFLAKMLHFKDHVAYTLLEQISCTGCDRAVECANAEVRPFSERCKYNSRASKPIASSEYLVDISRRK